MARVVVLLGGLSPERSVSLSSGAGCVAAVRRLGHEAIEIDPADSDWIEQLRAAKADVVLNALHGEYGEDGRTQGVLDYLRLPYTHSGVLASALAMDKAKTKAVLAGFGVPSPAGLILNRFEAAKSHPMAPPYVVKPNAQGSSVGVFIVREGANRPPEQLLDPEWNYASEVLVEEFIAGRELTVAVLNGKALCVTEILTSADFYDFDAKYASGGSWHELPAKLPESVTADCLRFAEIAHAAIGCRGLTRSDFRYDPEKNRVAFIEINTQPGMTPTSLAPEQAVHAGMTYDDLVAWMLEDASWPR